MIDIRSVTKTTQSSHVRWFVVEQLPALITTSRFYSLVSWLLGMVHTGIRGRIPQTGVTDLTCFINSAIKSSSNQQQNPPRVNEDRSRPHRAPTEAANPFTTGYPRNDLSTSYELATTIHCPVREKLKPVCNQGKCAERASSNLELKRERSSRRVYGDFATVIYQIIRNYWSDLNRYVETWMRSARRVRFDFHIPSWSAVIISSVQYWLQYGTLPHPQPNRDYHQSDVRWLDIELLWNLLALLTRATVCRLFPLVICTVLGKTTLWSGDWFLIMFSSVLRVTFDTTTELSCPSITVTETIFENCTYSGVQSFRVSRKWPRPRLLLLLLELECRLDHSCCIATDCS